MTPFTRRQMLAATAGLPALAAGKTGYKLGCQTLPYRAYPVERALEGIRKAGYRYVHIFHAHQNQKVFTPDVPPAARAELRRKIADNGLELFLSFVGLTADIRKPEGFTTYLKELDMCAEFGIRTVVGTGPGYYTRFPKIPKRAKDWETDVAAFYPALERAVRHAVSLGVIITIKPHTGIAATAKAGIEMLQRLPSEHLKVCWDAGNVSFYEGIHPDPDLPDLAPQVKAVCVKDHLGLRGDGNFPVPGQGQIDHDLMFKILFGAGFNGPLAVERVDGKDNAAKMPPELIDERIAAARAFLVPLLEKHAGRMSSSARL